MYISLLSLLICIVKFFSQFFFLLPAASGSLLASITILCERENLILLCRWHPATGSQFGWWEEWAGCQLHLISLLEPLVRVQSAQVSVVALSKVWEYWVPTLCFSFQDTEVAETVVNKSLDFGFILKCWSPFCSFLVH